MALLLSYWVARMGCWAAEAFCTVCGWHAIMRCT
jgi:hypothetical protein